MGNVVTVTRIWHDGVLSTGTCEISLNCDMLIGTTPRPGWLQDEGGCCGSEAYGLTLEQPANLNGVIEGVWIETKDGKGMLIDAATVQDVRDACNACCGTVPAIPTRYGGIYPQPVDPEPATYTITRTDYGDFYAYNKMSLDYMGQYISGSFKMVSHDDGTGLTTYTFAAYKDPTMIGTDTLVSHTDRVFISNSAPTLDAGEELTLAVIEEGNVLSPILTGATVAALVTAATGSAEYSALGTWAAGTDPTTIQLTSATAQYVQITIGKQTTGGGFAAMSAGPAPDQEGGGDTDTQATALSSQPLSSGTQPPVPQSGKQTGEQQTGTLSTGEQKAAPSTSAPPPQSEQQTGSPGTAEQKMNVAAAGMSTSASQVQQPSGEPQTGSPDTGDLKPTATGTPQLRTEADAANQKMEVEFTSNTVPKPGDGEKLTLTVDVDGKLLAPVLTGANLAELIQSANNSEQYAALGTWSAKGDRKIKVITSKAEAIDVAIGKTKE